MVIFGLAAILRTAAWWVMPWTFLEAAICAVLFLIYFSIKPIHSYFFRLPVPHRAIFASFLALMLVGQFADKSWLTFPFPTWNMYTESDKSTPGEFFELYGITPDGTSYPVDPGRLAGGGMMTFSMVSKFRAIARGAFFGDRPDRMRNWYKENLAEFMRAAGRVHNQEYPNQMIRQVELHHVKTDRYKRGAEAFTRLKLWDVSL